MKVSHKMGFVQTFLSTMVKPTLGCTEPICVALASAYARSTVGGEIRKIEVLVDPNIFKNGMGAGIPKTDGIILDIMNEKLQKGAYNS